MRECLDRAAFARVSLYDCVMFLSQTHVEGLLSARSLLSCSGHEKESHFWRNNEAESLRNVEMCCVLSPI